MSRRCRHHDLPGLRSGVRRVSLGGLARSSSEEGTRSRGDAARDPRRNHEPGRGSSQVEKAVDEVEEPHEGKSQFATVTSFDVVNTPWSPLRRAVFESARARWQDAPAKLVGGALVATPASGIGGESPGEDEIPGEHRARRWLHRWRMRNGLAPGSNALKSISERGSDQHPCLLNLFVSRNEATCGMGASDAVSGPSGPATLRGCNGKRASGRREASRLRARGKL